MKRLTMYGFSDDLIEVEGDVAGADEYMAGTNAPHMGYLHVTDGTHNIEIHAIYAGSWAFAICPQDGDGDQMPPWEIRRLFGDKTRYSETIYIDLPDNARCVWVK